MKNIEKQLDRLIQQACHNQRCHICRINFATAMHHIITRARKLFRYDIVNIIPVCNECHRKIHDQGLKVQNYIPKEQWEYLLDHKNDDYKDWLIQNGKTEDEYLYECKKEWEKQI